MRSVFEKFLPTSKSDGHQENSTALNIFTEDDIQDLLEKFNLDSTQLTRDQAAAPLVQAKSKTGLIQIEYLVKYINNFIENGKGRTSLSTLAEKFDLHESHAREMLENNAIIFHNGNDILSKSDQNRLYESLLAQTQSHFVHVDDFCDKEKISTDTLSTILEDPARNSLESELCSGQIVSETYYFSPSLRKKLEDTVVNGISKAVEEKSITVWKQHDMLGLTVHQFLQVVSKLIEKGDYTGSLRLEGSVEVKYEPEGYVSDIEQQLAASLADGSKPYVALDQLLKSPSQNSNKDSAELFKKFEILNEGTIQIVSSYALSKRRLDQQYQKALKLALSGGPVNLQTEINIYPSPVQREALRLLQNKTNEKEHDISIFDAFLVPRSWIRDIEGKASETAADLAEESWTQDVSLKPKSSALKSRLQEYVGTKLAVGMKDTEVELLNLLWRHPSSQLHDTAQEAFLSRTNQLEARCSEQFTRLWTSRVVEKTRLYARGVQGLEQSSLRTQLEELLQSHLATDVILAAANRARSKGLLRNTRLKIATRLPKLQSSIAERKDLSAMLGDLEKFDSQMEIPEYDDATYQDKKATHIQDMVSSMQKDQDAPRLFVCLLIVLAATRHDGVLYATGKFAPKLLKLIKPELEAHQAQRLEELKDAIRAGKVTDGMKEEMREMAQQATQS